MRLAVSGTHGVGKSTLVADLARALPGHVAVPEPYVVLADEGHAFSDPPSLEDYEVQLERSLASLADAARRDVVFERCPADFLAYAAAREHANEFDFEEWLPRVRVALETLDLVIYVPLDRPAKGFRGRVDERLREILVDDIHGFGVRVVEVKGTPEERTRAVLAQAQ